MLILPSRLGLGQAATSDESWISWIGQILADPLTAGIIGGAVVLVVAYMANWIARRLILGAIHRVTRKTTFRWDDVLLQRKVFDRLANLAPAVAVYYGVTVVPSLPAAVASAIQSVTAAVMVILAVVTVDAFLSAVHDLYAETPAAKGKPIKGYVQVVKIVVYALGGVVAIASLTGKSPLLLLSGLGAMTAVLLLIFRDTILSFVASLQLGTYDLVRIGDWIEMPQYGADGDVVDVALHTVRVQNWDKTITTIPTHKLISDAVKNWRGMSESGGRRIKRALHIDMNSIRFLTDEELTKFEHFAALRDYVRTKRRELAEYNAQFASDPGLIVNARRMTNIGTLRAYLVSYLRNHPKVHNNMTLIVRQLAPTADGLPIEIYAFANDTAWAAYEALQSDIFDHVLAILPEFGLRVYQNPSGRDFASLAGTQSGQPA